MRTATLVMVLVFSITSIGEAQKNTVTIDIHQPAEKVEIQSNMFGVFFEDINFAADGGLYAELIKNRSFDFKNSPAMGWLCYGKTEIKKEGGPFDRNPHYMRLTNTGLLTGTGIINEGFRGIGVEEGKEYKLSFYARNVDNDENILIIELISSGSDLIKRSEIVVFANEWTRYSLVLSPAYTDSHAKVRLDLKTAGTVDLEHISMFPKETYKNRENGMRTDLARALEDLKPGVFRFPGGYIIEGNSLETR